MTNDKAAGDISSNLFKEWLSRRFLWRLREIIDIW